MLIYSMSVSVDGFIADRGGGFAWTVPSEEQFRFHVAQTRELGAFADVWCAIPKVVFSRTLDNVQGNARLAAAPLADESCVCSATRSSSVAARPSCRRS